MNDMTDRSGQPTPAEPSGNERRQGRRTVLNLILLAILFAVILFFIVGPPSDGNTVSKIYFSLADLEQVSATFERVWNRKPTYEELTKAFDITVRSEVLYREALARGLDRDDSVIQMSLVRKITVLGAAQAQVSQPSENEIEAYFELRQDKYRLPARLGLEQVFLGNESNSKLAGSDIDQYLTKLNQTETVTEELAAISYSSLLPGSLPDNSETELSNIFGERFVEYVLTLPENQWQGPVESGYGLHLVRINYREDSRVPQLREVRDEVISDMMYEGQKAAEEQFYAEVLPRYNIVFDTEVSDFLAGNEGIESMSDK